MPPSTIELISTHAPTRRTSHAGDVGALSTALLGFRTGICGGGDPAIYDGCYFYSGYAYPYACAANTSSFGTFGHCESTRHAGVTSVIETCSGVAGELFWINMLPNASALTLTSLMEIRLGCSNARALISRARLKEFWMLSVTSLMA